MGKISKDNLKLLMDDFLNWFSKDRHNRNENLYDEFQNIEYWLQLSDNELIEVMTTFVKNGGGIQSGGHRFASKFKESLELNLKEFRNILFRIISGEIGLEDWWRSMDIFKSFGIGTRSIFLNRINPIKYIICNQKTIDGLKLIGFNTRLPIDSFKKYQEVQSMVEEFKSYCGLNLTNYQIDSLWEYLVGQKLGHQFLANIILNQNNYWIFQGNPDYYDFDRGFRDNLINSWSVSSHIDKINAGDKIIIWITGKNAGCYALAEALDKPKTREDDIDEHLWKKDDKSEYRVAIKITHNLIDSPILKSQIDENVLLSSLKAGNQGTNFSATKEEYHEIIKMVEFGNKRRYWLYSPGESAKLWDECYNKGVMLLGWTALGDLNKYSSKEEIRKQLQEDDKTESNKVNDTMANFEFANGIKIGDIIIAKRGRRELLGYGIVESDYFFDDSKDYYKSSRKVKWQLKGEWKTDHSLVLKTLTDITDYPTEHPDFEFYYERLLSVMNANQLIKNVTHTFYFPKNLILYGPPGTGKTYSSKDRATEILGKEPTIGVNCFFITFHQSYSYEQFIEGLNVRTENNQAVYNIRDGIFKKAADTAKLNKDENIVLIIDEINRGNISKIFGELITLIEDDKRLGEDNEIIVTLPYSGEQFGVPPNLYIIGTMNTADRSLVQLDTALRRRFDFEEMMPKYHLTEDIKKLISDKVRIDELHWSNSGKVNDIDLSLFLYKLNDKICKEYDREHQIGHSYLMKVSDLTELQRAWENRIMPLLQEYFYSSLDSLAQVIGSKSKYLKQENDTWVLNMRVGNGDFTYEFKTIYDAVVPKPEADKNPESKASVAVSD